MSIPSSNLPLDTSHQLAPAVVEDQIATALIALATLHSTPFGTVADAIHAYLEVVMQALGVRSAIITQLDASLMHVLHAADRGGCGIPAPASLPIETSFCQYVRASGHPIIVTDAAQDARVMHVATRTMFTIGAYLGVPLKFSTGKVYGTLCALDPSPCLFSQMHLAIVQLAAQQIAVLLERELSVPTLEMLPASIATNAAVQAEQSALLHIVVHDIRTPLSTLQGYLELFGMGILGVVTPEQQKGLSRMRDALQFINRLTTDLLDAAASETGTISLLSYAFDPSALAQQVIEACQKRATERGLTLYIQHETNLPQVIGDADRLQQVLLNLMNNALRYTERGSITLSVTMYKTMVQWSVTDTGPGIAEAQQEHIWQIYTRTSQAESGLGLGLYIVRRLVYAMNGEVGIHSAVGQGSTFWVRLPVQGPAPQRTTLLDAAVASNR